MAIIHYAGGIVTRIFGKHQLPLPGPGSRSACLHYPSPLYLSWEARWAEADVQGSGASARCPPVWTVLSSIHLPLQLILYALKGQGAGAGGEQADIAAAPVERVVLGAGWKERQVHVAKRDRVSVSCSVVSDSL